MTINVSDLTSGIVDGTGVFDELMKAINAQLSDQLKKGRITHDQYAQVYAQLVTQVMAQSVQFLTAQQQADLIAQQIISERAKVEDTIDGKSVGGVIGAQKDVFIAQKEGFKRDALQKFMKTYVDVWNVQRTTDDAISPNTANKLVDDNIGIAIKALADELGVRIN